MTIRHTHAPPMKPVVALAWLQIGIAVVLFAVSNFAMLHAPMLGMRWREISGVVTEVVPGGAAERAGIVAGDRIVSVDGRRVVPEAPPFYYAVAGQPLRITLSTPSGQRDVTLVAPPRVEWRWNTIFRGGPEGLRALASVLRLAVNLFVLFLALALMLVRGEIGPARVAALALAYYVGGNRLASIPAFGTSVPGGDLAHGVLHILDFWYLSGFFALMLHFAMLFPDALPFLRRDRRWNFAPYVATIPLFIPSIADWLNLFHPGFLPLLVRVPAQLLYEIYGPMLLTLVAVLLAVHFRYTADQNDLRRLRLVFVALLPAMATWILAVQTQYLDVSPMTTAIVVALQWVGAAVGIGIFTYAVIRHRLFGFRPLLRKSIQYALARGTLGIGLALPAVALLLFLYSHRDDSLAEVLTQEFITLLAILIPMAFLFRYRQSLLDMIDRRFFREDYDARHALMRVVSMIERGTDIMVLGRVALLEIEKALHPVHASLWLLDSGDVHFQRVIAIGQERPAPVLARSDSVLQILIDRDAPVEIDGGRPTGVFRRLGPSEIGWLGATGASLIVPLAVDREVIGFLALGERLSEEPYGTDDRELLTSIAAQLALTEDYGRLEILARRDPLTEALNRHAFYSLLEKKRVFPFQITGGGVAVVDVNNLKRINDEHGHAAGDDAIRRVASAVRATVRADDLVFRWGGDEFLVILFGLSEADVRSRLASLNDSLRMPPSGAIDVPVTVSIGVSQFDDVTELTNAIEMADRAMYEAKKVARRRSGEVDVAS